MQLLEVTMLARQVDLLLLLLLQMAFGRTELWLTATRAAEMAGVAEKAEAPVLLLLPPRLPLLAAVENRWKECRLNPSSTNRDTRLAKDLERAAASISR